MTGQLHVLHDAGQSIWFDELSRARIQDGSLAQLIAAGDIQGVTTNPSIFAAAITGSPEYAMQLAECKSAGVSAATAVTELMLRDVQQACDLFSAVFAASGGSDGRVSLEVEPDLAHDTAATVARAKELWKMLDRPNAMIKIPATAAGIAAIPEVIGAGISVNVTLIFGLPRYREVLNAYQAGLEVARAAGIDISTIHSVASVFVSRFDTMVDSKLRQAEANASSLTGKMGVANAQLCHEIYTQSLGSVRWQMLAAAGANPQRLLWASTGVKDAALPDTLYVQELIAAETVTTLPEKTLDAARDHLSETFTPVPESYGRAAHILSEIQGYGIEYSRVCEQLEAEGLAKFQEAWDGLLESIKTQL